jgi:hypothetical protein
MEGRMSDRTLVFFYAEIEWAVNWVLFAAATVAFNLLEDDR